MPKFLKNTAVSAAFIAGLLAILLLLSAIMAPKNNGKEDGMPDAGANGVLAETANTIDVLILGDSEACCSIIPNQIWTEQGITSYCCSTPGQNLPYASEFLHKTYDNQSPKVVVLETNMIYTSFSVGDTLIRTAQHALPVLRYHNRWKSLNQQDMKLRVHYNRKDKTRGFLNNETVAPANIDGYMAPTDECETLKSKNFKYLKKIKDYCEEHGSKLILVSTPSTLNCTMKRHNGLQKVADELGLDFIDMNLLCDEVPIDWNTDTRDNGNHLNRLGACKVTTYLGKCLASTQLLTNHQGDADFDEWNK